MYSCTFWNLANRHICRSLQPNTILHELCPISPVSLNLNILIVKYSIKFNKIYTFLLIQYNIKYASTLFSLNIYFKSIDAVYFNRILSIINS